MKRSNRTADVRGRTDYSLPSQNAPWCELRFAAKSTLVSGRCFPAVPMMRTAEARKRNQRRVSRLCLDHPTCRSFFAEAVVGSVGVAIRVPNAGRRLPRQRIPARVPSPRIGTYHPVAGIRHYHASRCLFLHRNRICSRAICGVV